MPNTYASELNKRFVSHGESSQLIELYTSQGCSSCPPAERWISNFKHDQKLWTSLFPLAFHVDYWDYIGWEDEFAKPAYGARQRHYNRLGFLNQVATPGFVVSGAGWNGWYRGQRLSSAESVPGLGELVLQVDGRDMTVRYVSDHIDNQAPSYKVNIALLGFDLLSKIDAGENRGKNLTQDFVVLSLHREFLLGEKMDNQDKESWSGRAQLPTSISDSGLRAAIVVWISQGSDPRPLQVAGGWL